MEFLLHNLGLKEADDRLYEAKNSGRNKTIFRASLKTQTFNNS